MKKQQGFTLIEMILFIVVTAILANTIILVLNTSLKTPAIMQNTIAKQTAQQCIEWFIGQRHLNGYSSIACPSSTIPTFCSSPSGYTLSVNIQCTTVNSDANYKTITVSVTGNGNASLATLIANY